jgi:Leucine-rich repeat (LRR) protein
LWYFSSQNCQSFFLFFAQKCLQNQNIVPFQIENLDKLTSLEQLYLSNNGIEAIENLEQNGSITTLDLVPSFGNSISAEKFSSGKFWTYFHKNE